MNDQHLDSSYKNILVVDDTPDNLRILSASLTQRGYQVRCVKNGVMALLTAKKNPPDLILLDIKMPDMDGYEVCRKLKANDATSGIPIIFLSALDDVFDKLKAFEVGGVDYVTKPFQIEEVIVRVQHQLSLRVAQAKIYQLNAELERKVHQRTAELEAVVSQLHQEVAHHKQTQQKLLQQALQDELTGLPNRTLFMEHLQKALKDLRRHQNTLFAVLFIDLDRFKVINDSWGHTVGDQLLIAFTRILKECIREIDTLARLSGDEFTILLENLQDVNDAIAFANRLLDKLTIPIHLDVCSVFVNASIGIVLGSPHYQNGTELLRDADIAMYRAKALGKGRYAVFDREMYTQTVQLTQLETDLRYALERQEFLLHYQPVVSLATNQIIGFEALIRWQHPERGLVYPGDFIEIAEDTGLIVPIGKWVLQEACQQLSTWQQQFPAASSTFISVNLSSRQLKQFDLIYQLAEILRHTGLDGQNLRLELTESMLMDHGEKTLELLSQIKRQNIQLSIDDFGTGYSSLSYLYRFPIDALKVDRSFISPIGTAVKNCEIVKAIITLAHSLSLVAIAEGVETPHQLEQLKKLGCDAAQGYLFSKPVDAQLVARLLHESSWAKPLSFAVD
jgi:diguanylate cyclase (GGDEF)-like protein